MAPRGWCGTCGGGGRRRPRRPKTRASARCVLAVCVCVCVCASWLTGFGERQPSPGCGCTQRDKLQHGLRLALLRGFAGLGRGHVAPDAGPNSVQISDTHQRHSPCSHPPAGRAALHHAQHRCLAPAVGHPLAPAALQARHLGPHHLPLLPQLGHLHPAHLDANLLQPGGAGQDSTQGRPRPARCTRIRTAPIHTHACGAAAWRQHLCAPHGSHPALC